MKETRYKVDTVHGHRVPVAQEQKQKWKRRLSPIKRRVEQGDEHVEKNYEVKIEREAHKSEEYDEGVPNENCEKPFDESEDIPRGNCEDILDDSEDKQSSANTERDEMKVSSEPKAVEDIVDVHTNENVVEDLQAAGNLEEDALAVPYSEESDSMIISRQDGDDCTTTLPESNNSDNARGKVRSISAKSIIVNDAVRKLVESMVSRISPELCGNAELNSSLFPSSNESSSDNKQLVSFGIQTDWKELESVDGTKISLPHDGCSSCDKSGMVGPCVNEEQSTTQRGSMLCTPQTEERQQLGYAESYSSDKLDADNSDGRIQNADDNMVHVTMSKGTMTPTKHGWKSLEGTNHQDQESPVADGPTTPLADLPSSVAAQHILEVPGLGRMNITLQAQHAVQPENSDMDVVTESVSGSDEQLQGILIGDSGGDYTSAVRTESRVSIYTFGHGDQRMAISSSSLGNIPSPQQDVGNILASESRSREMSRASDVNPAEERAQDSRPSSRDRPQTVQELIDNLIAERLNGVPEREPQKNESVTVEESESPLADVITLFPSKNDEVTDHQCDVFGNDTHSNENHPEVLLTEETLSTNSQPDDVETITPTGETNLSIISDECFERESGKSKRKCADHELQDAFLAMDDAVAAAKLIIRYLGRTDARLRSALHRTGPCDDNVVNCPAAERVAQEAHAFAVRTQSVFMTYFRLAEAEDTFREFVLKEIPGTEKERRQLRRWWTINQPEIDDIPDDNSDILEGEPEP